MEDDYQSYAYNFTLKVIPLIESIITLYVRDRRAGVIAYLDFITEIKPSIERMVKLLRDPREVGIISPRLLRDPTTSGLLKDDLSLQEEIAHIVGYLRAILLLGFFRAKGLKGEDFSQPILPEYLRKSSSLKELNNIRQLVQYVKNQIVEIELAIPHSSNNRDLNSEGNFSTTVLFPEEKKDTDNKNALPFTARLMAYYRGQDTKTDNPLIVDPLAEKLAGDMTQYADEHKFVAARGDYPLVRSFYIENNLLVDWCSSQKKSQIVILGAGLDTRAYRFQPLQDHEHTVFEVDFKEINDYKKRILKKEIPLCKLIRVSADLSSSSWISSLVNCSYSIKFPTFWILEGFVYYLERKTIESLLKQIAEISNDSSQIFVDLCVPTLAELKFGPFSRYFKWGLKLSDIPLFFTRFGWNVKCSYADKYDQGRDVGQRGLIFVEGSKLI